MANPPQLGDAEFPRLKKNKPSYGIIFGSDIDEQTAVLIENDDASEQWLGSVGSQLGGISAYFARVHYLPKARDKKGHGHKKRIVETVTVTVSNTSGPSNPVTTDAEVS